MPGTIWGMKVEGVYSFPGPPQQVWDLLLNPDSLRTCIPGAESLTETSPDHFDAIMKVGVAAIKGTYKVDLVRPRNVAEIRFDPRFNEIYQLIWNDLREEVLVSYERAKRSAAA